MIVLNSKQTLFKLPLDQAIDAIERVMHLYNDKRTITPQRHFVYTNEGPTIFMPSMLVKQGNKGEDQEKEQESGYDTNVAMNQEEDTLGIKVVSVRPKIQAASVPAVIMLLDIVTGLPNLMFNATDSTAIRTACCSAVASKYLARKESKVLAVLGCGQQGKYHALTCCITCPNIDTVILWNRSEGRAVDLRNELVQNRFEQAASLPFQFVCSETESNDIDSDNQEVTKRKIRVRIINDANEAVKSGDVICTCTNTNQPLFDGRNVKLGAHVNCIGSYRHDMQEVDSYLVSHSRMVADDAESVWHESGDVNIPLKEGLISKDHILLDNLGQLDENTAKSIVRTDYEADITLFKCVGMAAQDMAIAQVIWNNIRLNDKEHQQVVDIS